MKLIDTDIVIDHFHGHHAAMDYFAETLAAGEALAISVITLTSDLQAGGPTTDCMPAVSETNPN